MYADEAKSSSRLHAGGTGGGVGSVETRASFSAAQYNHVPIDSPPAKLLVLMAIGYDAGAAGIEPDRSEPEPTTAEPLTATVVVATELKLRQTLGYQLS